MYRIRAYPEVEAAANTMPADLPPFYAEVRVAIEADAWSGRPLDVERPGNMRMREFGPPHRGAHVVYFALEEQRVAVLVQLHWLD